MANNYDCLKTQIDTLMVDVATAKNDISITPQPNGGPPAIVAHGEGSFPLSDGTYQGLETVDITVTPHEDKENGPYTDIVTNVKMDAKSEGQTSARASFTSEKVNPPDGKYSDQAGFHALKSYHRVGNALAVCGPWPKVKGPGPQ